MDGYAKVVIKGSPISKSNFKLFNLNGRAILPMSSGKYHDRYAVYEEQIAYEARVQNPGVVISESLIAILKVYYKSVKRHPDTNNITKSIFDGIEKSGLIVNDAQIKRIVLDEYYDKENPRFELELYCESKYDLSYKLTKKSVENMPINYNPPSNRLSQSESSYMKKKDELKISSENNTSKSSALCCSICKIKVTKNDYITGNKGKTIICKLCFSKLF
ncbi:MAG TPA: RusA family crossover junction endodeoxyribonuclease [Clostridiaceae bacterium]